MGVSLCFPALLSSLLKFWTKKNFWRRREMRKLVLIGLCMLFVAGTVSATPVPVTLVSADFDDLLGGSASAVGIPLTTDMSIGNLMGEVVSQAFTDGAGSYAYLYQVRNTGSTGNNVIEAFTCSPFLGVSASATLGYLTDNFPAGFTLGEQASAGASVDAAAGPTVSFGFPAWLAQAIDPGEASSTFYVFSNGTPGMITGNIIDGATGSGEVVGPVPEPATICLLGLGVLGLLRRKRA
jgi:hypothetical protein